MKILRSPNTGKTRASREYLRSSALRGADPLSWELALMVVNEQRRARASQGDAELEGIVEELKRRAEL